MDASVSSPSRTSTTSTETELKLHAMVAKASVDLGAKGEGKTKSELMRRLAGAYARAAFEALLQAERLTGSGASNVGGVGINITNLKQLVDAANKMGKEKMAGNRTTTVGKRYGGLYTALWNAIKTASAGETLSLTLTPIELPNNKGKSTIYYISGGRVTKAKTEQTVSVAYPMLLAMMKQLTPSSGLTRERAFQDAFDKVFKPTIGTAKASTLLKKALAEHVSNQRVGRVVDPNETGFDKEAYDAKTKELKQTKEQIAAGRKELQRILKSGRWDDIKEQAKQHADAMKTGVTFNIEGNDPYEAYSDFVKKIDNKVSRMGRTPTSRVMHSISFKRKQVKDALENVAGMTAATPELVAYACLTHDEREAVLDKYFPTVGIDMSQTAQLGATQLLQNKVVKEALIAEWNAQKQEQATEATIADLLRGESEFIDMFIASHKELLKGQHLKTKFLRANISMRHALQKSLEAREKIEGDTTFARTQIASALKRICAHVLLEDQATSVKQHLTQTMGILNKYKTGAKAKGRSADDNKALKGAMTARVPQIKAEVVDIATGVAVQFVKQIGGVIETFSSEQPKTKKVCVNSGSTTKCALRPKAVSGDMAALACMAVLGEAKVDIDTFAYAPRTTNDPDVGRAKGLSALTANAPAKKAKKAKEVKELTHDFYRKLSEQEKKLIKERSDKVKDNMQSNIVDNLRLQRTFLRKIAGLHEITTQFTLDNAIATEYANTLKSIMRRHALAELKTQTNVATFFQTFPNYVDGLSAAAVPADGGEMKQLVQDDYEYKNRSNKKGDTVTARAGSRSYLSGLCLSGSTVKRVMLQHTNVKLSNQAALFVSIALQAFLKVLVTSALNDMREKSFTRESTSLTRERILSGVYSDKTSGLYALLMKLGCQFVQASPKGDMVAM